MLGAWFWLSACLCQSVCVSACMPACMSAGTCVCLSISLSVYPGVLGDVCGACRLLEFVSVCLSICVFACLSAYLCPSFQVYMGDSCEVCTNSWNLCLCVCLSIPLSVYPGVLGDACEVRADCWDSRAGLVCDATHKNCTCEVGYYEDVTDPGFCIPSEYKLYSQ